jgi:hypothetical protein
MYVLGEFCSSHITYEMTRIQVFDMMEDPHTGLETNRMAGVLTA